MPSQVLTCRSPSADAAMWLLPVFSPIARWALRAFYRFRTDGAAIPQTGAALLVANHPNSLLDPAAVVAIAGRPVRFLAKAPLFRDRLVGWLIRASGAIPVYRRQDDPTQAARNDDTFRAAQEALRAGNVVGIFPEGLSHSGLSLAPLRTGAARIALGAAKPLPRAFPIVPVGLVFRDKQRFRSVAIIISGNPIGWDDLVGRDEADVDAVRELTRRIDDGLRDVTINLERRQDAQIVVLAEELFNTERGVRLPEHERVRALREVSLGLSRLRSGERADWLPLARAVALHGRELEALGLRPDQLSRPGGRAAASWTLRQLLLLGSLIVPAVAGILMYWLPFRITDRIAHRAAPTPDAEATYKLLVGAVAHLLWTALMALVVGAWLGWAAGAAAAVLLPLLGWVAVRFLERLAEARATARRFLVRERREADIAALQTRQAELARRLGELRESVDVRS